MKNDLKVRFKLFALRIIKLANALPKNAIGNVIRYQIIKSGTSSAANYRAARRGKSKLDFIAKLGIVEEELDETCFWMEILIDAELMKKELIINLYEEANQLLAIIVSSKKTARMSQT